MKRFQKFLYSEVNKPVGELNIPDIDTKDFVNNNIVTDEPVKI